MAEYTTLMPVVLANDDYYDEEQTFVKQPYTQTSEFECAQRYTSVQHINVSPIKDLSEETELKHCYTSNTCSTINSTLNCAQQMPCTDSINISSRQLVQVTPDNVNALFRDLSCEADVHSDTLDKLIKLYRDLPKDLFVSRILSDNSSDEMRLKELRYSVFSELKTHQEFPFSASTELKRRKNTRLGESVAMKLCFDIYVIISVIEGAPFDDIKDIIRVGKSTVSNDSVCSEQTKHNPCAANLDNINPEITLLQNLIIDIQADILAMKHDSNELREEISAIKKDVKVIRGDLSQQAENVSSSIDAVRCSIDKVIDSSQNGVTCVKNDIKQIRSDVSSLSDTISTQYEQLKETIAVVQKVEKRISRTDKKISNLEQRRVASYDQKLAHSVDTQDSRNHDVIHVPSDSDSEQQSNATPNNTETVDTATVSRLHRSPRTGRFTRVHSYETQIRETASNRPTTVFSKDTDLSHMFTNPKKDANTTHCATNNENHVIFQNNASECNAK